MANVTNVATISAMQALPPAAGLTVFLNANGREGLFECRAGTPPTADPLNGIYVTSGKSGFYWARVWDGVAGKPEWFGAVTGDGSTAARTATLAALNAAVTLLPSVELASATYYTNGTWRISQSGRRVTGQGRDKSAISSNHPTAHIIHCGGMPGAYYAERPFLCGMTLVRTVPATVPPSPNQDDDTGHALHMRMTSNATVREVDTMGTIDGSGKITGSNLVGTYWANALSPLWEDCFDLMTGQGARSYSFMLDGTQDDGLGPRFPSLIVFRAREVRMSNAGNAALSRGMIIIGSYTDMQVDRVETAKVHHGLLCLGGGSNAHFNSHWHDSYLADGIRIDKTGADSGDNLTLVDCYCAPGVGATGQPITLINAQNVQIVAAQISAFPGGGNGKIGVLFSNCVNCTITAQVVNHSTGVKFDKCFGCNADVKVMQLAGPATEGIRVQGGFGNTARCGIVGVPKSVGFQTGVAIAASGGNQIDLTGVIDSAVTNRLTIDGKAIANAGNAPASNFVIRPGAAFNAAAS